MLREISRFRNYGGCANRRCFTDSDMDLYVWFKHQEPTRFHLAYNKQGRTHSISWDNDFGFDLQHFDAVEFLAVMLGLPVAPDSVKDISASLLANRFLRGSEKIEPWLADFIYARLLEYPGRTVIHANRGTALGSF